jgi:DNA-binding response OmpR family regulator
MSSRVASGTRILAIEDNPLTADLLVRCLSQAGYEVDVLSRGAEALGRLDESQYDVVLLDLSLPDFDGLELCRQLRARGDLTPVLVLSARDRLDDRVEGLRSGADDYLTKPFKTIELEARVHALIRRGQRFQEPKDLLQLGTLSMDVKRRRVVLEGHLLTLTPKEFALLEFLLRNAGAVYSADELHDRLWGGPRPQTNVVQVALHQLRSKLRTRATSVAIETIRGFGYRLTDRIGTDGSNC